MRFAIATSDRYLGVFKAFVGAGWQPVKLFTVPLDNVVNHNRASIHYAGELGIPVQISQLLTHDLEDLQRLGCDALIVASYDWRIPDWQTYLRYAFNFHPSPLPVGRGPYPLHQAILDKHRLWGVSCHKLTQEYDSGDLLDQQWFPITDADCHDSLSLRAQMAAQRLAARVAADVPGLWEKAQPQAPGSYWSKLPDQQWIIDFGETVDDILRRVRAFGSLECLAEVNQSLIFVRRAVGWHETHPHAPGSVVYSNGRNIVVAVRGGYIGIVEWSLIARNQVEQLGRS